MTGSLSATARPFRCSIAADERGDSMVATAPPARGWLLLELPGPWPMAALDALGPGPARRVRARAADVGARVVLVRRPGRHARRSAPYRWAYADGGPGREGIRWQAADDPADVLDRPWRADPGEGEPTCLVCAHSRHDACCAIRGRPVAEALEPLWPGRVWECSHLGGDRFAATMVLLPAGLCYGRVDVGSGPRILAAHERGLVVPASLRGRCALSRVEQGAQALARAAAGGGSGVDDLRPLHARTLDGGLHEVVLAGEPPLAVVLRERTEPLPTPATCRSVAAAVGYAYDLVAIGPAAVAG